VTRRRFGKPFQKIWRCQSCGFKLPDGHLLDCERCAALLDDQKRFKGTFRFLVYLAMTVPPRAAFPPELNRLVAQRIDEITVAP